MLPEEPPRVEVSRAPAKKKTALLDFDRSLRVERVFFSNAKFLRLSILVFQSEGLFLHASLHPFIEELFTVSSCFLFMSS
jgi:hypothetical protein